MNRGFAYLAIAGFCVLSSLRDVYSESIFSYSIPRVSPYYAIFVFSLLTQIIAAAIFAASLAQYRKRGAGHQMFWRELAVVNIFTAGAFIFYFMAIGTTLGSGMNAFVDYGCGPIATGLAGVFFLKEAVGRSFFVTAAMAVTGVAILVTGRKNGDFIVDVPGVAFALTSCLCTAVYTVYFKILLNKGVTKSAIIFSRLLLTTTICGLIVIYRSEVHNWREIRLLMIMGAAGFTLPLFLSLYVLRSISVVRFGMFLFLIPITNYLLSLTLGFTEFRIRDICAAFMIWIGISYYETVAKPTAPANAPAS